MATSPHVRAPHPWFSRWFGDYAAKRLRQGFHRVRLLGDSFPAIDPEAPLVIYGNHASWWDPMVALAVRPLFFPNREAYAPIDADMLERYGIFNSLGFFGVERDSLRGVAKFLDHAEAILRRPNALLFLTPQGRFADVRERPLSFQRGIAHLAERIPSALFLPLATEIAYWEESKPEILIHAGRPVSPESQPQREREALLGELEGALERAMDELAAASIARDPAAFRDVFAGSAGVGGLYDFWRTIKARVTGQPINLHHGDR